jgi:hypothetical protein
VSQALGSLGKAFVECYTRQATLSKKYRQMILCQVSKNTQQNKNQKKPEKVKYFFKLGEAPTFQRHLFAFFFVLQFFYYFWAKFVVS